LEQAVKELQKKEDKRRLSAIHVCFFLKFKKELFFNF